MPLTIAAVLDELRVPRSGVIYVQSSTDWLQKAGFAATDTLAALQDWTRPGGTLVMPAYPFRVPHLEYLASRPTFDLRRTPVAVGLIPEVFRRSAGVRRSLDPDFCIAAWGADADEIVATDLNDPDPFGQSSVYERLIRRGAAMVGLGVSLNTNSFIHVIDSRLSSCYPRGPYQGVFDVIVVDGAGVSKTVSRRALRPEFQRLTRPSAVADAVGSDTAMFASRSVGGAMFFRWDLTRWSRWCESHGHEAAAAGRWPCWLSQLADGSAA